MHKSIELNVEFTKPDILVVQAIVFNLTVTSSRPIWQLCYFLKLYSYYYIGRLFLGCLHLLILKHV